MGATKDPGVPLLCRLKSEWYSLDIDYGNLSKLDLSVLPEWMKQEGKDVLSWALQELDKNIWPREDYWEPLKLIVLCLGDEIDHFVFRLPGLDHHVRWMSKYLFFLKIKLLLHIFPLSEVEGAQVQEISTFILLFYVRNWFQAPLPASAARNDLSFMANVLMYRQVSKPKIAFSVMQSCYCHLWYLVPQTVVLALADRGLSDI